MVQDRFGEQRQSFVDRNFTPMPFTRQGMPPIDEPQPPDCLDAMLEMAELLAHDFAFVRVDLYDQGKPVFGEFSFTPRSGALLFDPPEWDERLGERLTFPDPA